MSFFTPAPTPPSTSDPTNFNARADAFLSWMSTFATQSEGYGAFLAAANMFGVVIPYIFSTTTTDSDPGAGVLRLGSATQNASTVIRADNLDSLGLDAAALINFMSAGTSTIKGVIRLMKAGDSRAWIYASVSAVAAPTGYKNITISVISSSSTNPFADGDAVILAFVPKGDKGDTGPAVDIRPNFVATEEGGAPSAGTAGRKTRMLNTVARNVDGWAFSSYQLTLPAGDYLVNATAAASGTDATYLALRNVTDSSDIVLGPDAIASLVGEYTFFTQALLPMMPFTLAASKVVRLEHNIAGTGGGLGTASKSAYMAIWKRG